MRHLEDGNIIPGSGLNGREIVNGHIAWIVRYRVQSVAQGQVVVVR